MTEDGGRTQWYERGEVGMEIEDTDVGREVSLYEMSEGEWVRRYTLPAGQARDYFDMMREVFSDE